MVERHRTFDFEEPTDQPTFKLRGKRTVQNPKWPGPSTKANPHKIAKTIRTEWTQDFTCVAMPPPGLAAVSQLGGSMVQDAETGERVFKATTIYDYIRGILIEDDQPVWDALLIDRQRPIDQQLVVDVYRWLVEVYAGRPT